MPVQSPIALSERTCSVKDDFPALRFCGHWDAVGTAAIQNTGTTAQVTMNRKDLPFIEGGPLAGKYIFEQLHFHWAENDNCGCEHTVEANTFSMECHLVHYSAKYKNFEEAVNKPDGLAVIGFFFQASGSIDCADFKKTTDALDYIQRPHMKVPIDADCLSWLQMQNLERHFYTYQGSLTTPPYYESVTWIVFKAPVYISKQQLAQFRNLQSSDLGKKINNNYRPVQKSLGHPDVIFTRNVKCKL